jgi:Sulfotransferase family
MRSTVIVLGAGRSGTSLVAGLLADAGFFPGERLIPASGGNRTGYFEDLDVNALNDRLLAPLLPRASHPVPPRLSWLAALPEDAEPRPTPVDRQRIGRHLPRRPMCLKDPRFTYTLGAWQPQLPPDAGYVCVFRHPSRVAASLAQEVARDPAYYEGFSPTDEVVWATWTCAYRYILANHASTGSWLFVDADALTDSADTAALSRFVGAPVTGARIDAGLRRSTRHDAVPREVSGLYRQLQRLSRAHGLA